MDMAPAQFIDSDSGVSALNRKEAWCDAVRPEVAGRARKQKQLYSYSNPASWWDLLVLCWSKGPQRLGGVVWM